MHQLNIMLVLTGICGIIAVFVFMSRTLSAKRKRILIMLELSAMFLLTFDRYAYLFRGQAGDLGYWMVRISNFIVFSMTLSITHAVNLYLADLLQTDGGLQRAPRALILGEIFWFIGQSLIIINLFTGIIYTFDDSNRYQRSPAYIISYIIPILIFVIQFIVIVRYYHLLRPLTAFSLILFTTVPVLASFVQLFSYGISLTNISMVGVVVLVYIFALQDLYNTVDRAKEREIELLKEEQKHMQRLFMQTATALVNAIDAKDSYTHGHSARVAAYSKKIAELAGKNPEESAEIYYSALLHDVGKIGIPENIITKNGRLTDEEYAIIKQHPVIGEQILSGITQYPYLSIAANYHHERYDGRGYPEGLKGDDIPEIARIVAVADAYDAMTSKRSYRDSIPQQMVREEIIKGSGYQFDPKFASIMQHLIDLDIEYEMREKSQSAELGDTTSLISNRLREDITEGILIQNSVAQIRFKYKAASESANRAPNPVFILFDSLDGRVYDDDKTIRDFLYFEYAQIGPEEHTALSGARKIQSDPIAASDLLQADLPKVLPAASEYLIRAVHLRDHLMIDICHGDRIMRHIVALPDSVRYTYIALTGENTELYDIEILKSEMVQPESLIPRIAKEITYIDVPAGDLPNVQVNGYRSDSTAGVPIEDGLVLSFHSMSLPTARLIWHCPFLVLFNSDDGKVTGDHYTEYALVRLDGEYWESHADASNQMFVDRTEDFRGWDAWKEMNKQGLDCSFAFRKEGEKIITVSQNGGISIRYITTINNASSTVYAALTGDQVALTNIRIGRANYSQRQK